MHCCAVIEALTFGIVWVLGPNVRPNGDSSFRNMYIFQPSGRTEAQRELVATSDLHVIFGSCRGIMKDYTENCLVPLCHICSSLQYAMNDMEAAATHI